MSKWCLLIAGLLLAGASLLTCGSQPGGDTSVPTPTLPSASVWTAEVVWGCDIDVGNGSTYSWTADITYEFSVGPEGKITGSGTGTSRRLRCTDPCCECSLTFNPFTVEISGLQQGDAFSIEMDPNYVMTQMLSNCCPGGTEGGATLFQLHYCRCPTGLPWEFTVDARHGAGRDIDCTVPVNASTRVAGWITIMRKEP
jgi:hypothetical protein